MIEIIRQKDDLSREVWEFNFMDYHRRPLIILEHYQVQAKRTKRHGWTIEESYVRTGRSKWTNSDEIPLPDDVVQEALQKFMEQVKVVKELGQ